MKLKSQGQEGAAEHLDQYTDLEKGNSRQFRHTDVHQSYRMEDFKFLYTPLIFSGKIAAVPVDDLISQNLSDSLEAFYQRRKQGRLDVYS